MDRAIGYRGLRIGILLLLTLSQFLLAGSATPVAAGEPSFAKEDCNTWNVGIDLFASRAYDDPAADKSLTCEYRPKETKQPYAKVFVRYFQDSGEAAAEFAKKRKSNEDDVARISAAGERKIQATSQGGDRFGYLACGHDTIVGSLHCAGNGVLLRHQNYYAEYQVSAHVDEAEGERLFRKAEAQTIALIDRLAQVPVLALAHYHPFEETIPEQFSGGDMVAVLTQDGEPVSGKQVFFFRNLSAGPNCDEAAFKFPFDSNTFGSEHEIVGLSKDYVTSHTDENGQASANYLSFTGFGSIDFWKLSEEIAKRGECRIPISAVVFDHLGDPEREPSIAVREDMELVFKGVARIVRVGTTDEREKPQGEAIVDRKGELRSVKSPDLIKPDPETSHRGYNLHAGDIIILSVFDHAEVQWLGGSHMVFKPNTKYMTRNNWAHVQVELWAKDVGWGSYIDSWIGIADCQGAVGTIGTVVGVFSTKAGAATVGAGATYLGVPAVAVLGWNAVRGYMSPILLEHKSEILIEFDDDGPTVYTAEGTATLYHPVDGSTADVGEGRKMALSPEGEFGPVERFDEDELEPDLAGLLDTVREQTRGEQSPGKQSQGEQSQAEAPEPAGSSEGAIQATGGDGDGSNLLGTIIVCCFPILLLIAGVLLIIVLIRRRKQSKQAAAPRPEAPRPEAPRPAAAPPPGPPAPPRPAPEPARHCQRCGSPLAAGVKFCGECGAQTSAAGQQQVNYCSNCGTANDPGRNFCKRCGTQLS